MGKKKYGRCTPFENCFIFCVGASTKGGVEWVGGQNKVTSTLRAVCQSVYARVHYFYFIFIQTTRCEKDIFYTVCSKMNNKKEEGKRIYIGKAKKKIANMVRKTVCLNFSFHEKNEEEKAESKTELLKMKDYFVCERTHNK